MTSGQAGRVTLARIRRARGLRGEVAAQILTDFPERLTRLREVWLWDSSRPASEPRRAALRRCWLQNDQAIFHFEGVDTAADAEKLAGLDVQIPLADRMPLPAGRYYVTDLIGCEVWEAGERLGAVRNVQLNTGTPLLVVETPRGELLVPMAEEFCPRIDTAARRIEVKLPEGLREL